MSIHMFTSILYVRKSLIEPHYNGCAVANIQHVALAYCSGIFYLILLLSMCRVTCFNTLSS